MSDAMSNHEIEDVLASIRRLVSDDLRPAAPRAAGFGAAGYGAAGAAQPLTSARRAEVDPEPRYRPQVVETYTPDAAADAALLLTPSLRVAEAPQAGFAETGRETVADSRAEFQPEPRFEPAPQPQAEYEAAPRHAPETAWPAAEPAPASETYDADWPTADAGAAGASRQDYGQFAETVESAPMAEEMAAAPNARHPAEDHWADRAEADLRARLEAEAMHQARAHASYTVGDDDGPMADSQELLFDEQVLRDLVRDIIREELAGNLGERLTRNVRKLVRAEIARALAVQEFG